MSTTSNPKPALNPAAQGEALSPVASEQPESAAKHISEAELLVQLLSVSKQLQAAKELYAEQDRLVLELLERGFKSALLPDGTQAVLVDNFIDPKTGSARNVVFRPAGVKRFEIDFTDEVTAAKQAARAAKRGAK